MKSMFLDWWIAHRFEIALDLVIAGLAIALCMMYLAVKEVVRQIRKADESDDRSK